MTLLSTPRGRILAIELQKLAQERLTQSLDAVAHAAPSDPPSPTALDELLIARLDAADPRLIRDAYVQLRDDRPILRPIRLLLVRRYGELRQLLRSRDLPATDLERQARLVSLVCFSAGVMIPLLAREGDYRRAVRLAGTIKRAVMSKAHRRVLGAGAAESDSKLRYLLLAPVLWSLAASMPTDNDEEMDHDSAA